MSVFSPDKSESNPNKSFKNLVLSEILLLDNLLAETETFQIQLPIRKKVEFKDIHICDSRHQSEEPILEEMNKESRLRANSTGQQNSRGNRVAQINGSTKRGSAYFSNFHVIGSTPQQKKIDDDKKQALINRFRSSSNIIGAKLDDLGYSEKQNNSRTVIVSC